MSHDQFIDELSSWLADHEMTNEQMLQDLKTDLCEQIGVCVEDSMDLFEMLGDLMRGHSENQMINAALVMRLDRLQNRIAELEDQVGS